MKPCSLPSRPSRLIGDGVGDARGREAPEAQAAGGAPATGVDLVLVARPGEFEGRPQLKPQAYIPPVQVDQGRVDGKESLGRVPNSMRHLKASKYSGRQSG